MARGAEAKKRVTEKLKEAFGSDFIGEYDKKVYVWSEEGGERMQIAFSMTCPKNLITTVNPTEMDFGGDLDFDKMSAQPTLTPTAFEPTEISEEEKATVNDLMEKLGLI